MKKIAIATAVFVLILLLTKIANQMPAEAPSGSAFAAKGQRVIQCSPGEITLVDSHLKATHLETDATWPECSAYQKDDVLDFYLSRGAKTKFLSFERTVWWRKAM